MSKITKKYLKVNNVNCNLYFPFSNNYFSKNENLKIFEYETESVKHFGYRLYKKNNFSIIDCVNCGYIHTWPRPSKKFLENYYINYYYKKIKKNYKIEQLKYLNWWDNIFEKRLNYFKKFLPNKKIKILDIGCGTGYFLNQAHRMGFEVSGIEPSKYILNQNVNRQVKNNCIIGSYEDIGKFNNKFDVIYTHGVLEHLRDPYHFLKKVSKHMSKNSLIFSSVANDFNPFQYVAMSEQKDPWWITPPDHLNYFNKDSFNLFLKKNNFKTVKAYSSFPIDIFLNFGIDYVNNKSLGKRVHKFRVNFEDQLFKNLSPIFVEKFYKNFYQIGIGRQIDIIAKKNQI